MNHAASFIGNFVIGAIVLWVVVFAAIIIIMLIAKVAQNASNESDRLKDANLKIPKIRKISGHVIKHQAQCDLCKNYLEFDPPFAGKQVCCPHCNGEIVLP